MANRLCVHHQRGCCPMGSSCMFSHEQIVEKEPGQWKQLPQYLSASCNITPAPTSDQSPAIEELYQPNAGGHVFTLYDITNFVLGIAREQSITIIIQYLSDEANGLPWLRSTVAEAPFYSQAAGGDKELLSFQHVVVPLLVTLTQPELVHSVFTKQVATILLTVGTSEFLANVARCLPPTPVCNIFVDNRIKLSTDGMPRSWLEAWHPVATFLLALMAVDTSKAQDPSVLRLASILTQVYERPGPVPRLPAALDRVLKALQARICAILSLHPQNSGPNGMNASPHTFSELSSHSAHDPTAPNPDQWACRRHDNDFTEFRGIAIDPTPQEVLCPLRPYLPTTVDAQPPGQALGPVAWQLDRIFRLLRYEMLSGLLCAAPLLQGTKQARPGPPTRGGVAGNTATPVYTNLQVLFLHVHEDLGKQAVCMYEVEFDQVGAGLDLGNGSKTATVTALQSYWSRSRRLRPGSLVCLSVRKPLKQEPLLLFAKVVYRSTTHSPSLAHSPSRARLGIMATAPTCHENLGAMVLRKVKAKVRVAMVEVCQEHCIHSHALEVLQTMTPVSHPMAYALLSASSCRAGVPTAAKQEAVTRNSDGGSDGESDSSEGSPRGTGVGADNLLVTAEGPSEASDTNTADSIEDPSQEQQLPSNGWAGPEREQAVEGVVEQETMDNGDNTDGRPAYMDQRTTFDLSCLATRQGRPWDRGLLRAVRPSSSSPRRPALLVATTSLDKSQAMALLTALASKITVIQGGPGTGKTFVGAQLVQVLLHGTESMAPSRPWQSSKAHTIPSIGAVVVLCPTEGGLHTLASALVGAGVKDMVVLDSTEDTSLLPLSLKGPMSKNKPQWHWKDRELAQNCLDKVIGLSSELGNVCKTFQRLRRRAVTWSDIRPTVALANPDVHHYIKCLAARLHQHSGASKDAAGCMRDPLGMWLNEETLPQSLQQDEHSRGFVAFGARAKYTKGWAVMAMQSVLAKLPLLVAAHQDANKDLATAKDNISLHVLRRTRVLCLTTACYTRYQALMAAFRPAVVVVDDAASVLEGHLLACLTEYTDHLVLLGDPRHMVPPCETPELRVEVGLGHDLNVSLLERLVAGGKVAVATLTRQHRLHPTMNAVLCHVSYPEMLPGRKVVHWPEVTSMAQRLVFVDHSAANLTGTGDTGDGCDRSNVVEVQWVVGLARYLLHQGYRQRDIVVLAPCAAQLVALFSALHHVAAVALSQGDTSLLAHWHLGIRRCCDHGTDGGTGTEVEALAQLAKVAGTGKRGNAIGLGTFSHYEGAEATIAIVSLGHSKATCCTDAVGSSRNINVMLSRASHGLYIFGSEKALRAAQTTGWPRVLDHLQTNGCIVPALMLRCPRHPDNRVAIKTPKALAKFGNQGGCDLPCGNALPCGHPCPRSCHGQVRAVHKDLVCNHPCIRGLACGHECPSACWEKCKPCEVVLALTLPCSHPATGPCEQRSDIVNRTCSIPVQLKMPGCGHEVTVACARASSTVMDPSQCRATCDTALPCGHPCGSKCGQCLTRTRFTGRVNTLDKTSHWPCTLACSQPLDCGFHHCTQMCHPGTACKPCESHCPVRCPHKLCTESCSQPCVLCPRPCAWACEHQGQCPLPCGAPCIRLPCDQRCQKVLDCGHRCPSLCGEVCPAAAKACPSCLQAHGGENALMLVDMVTACTLAAYDPNISPIVSLPCGHILTVSTLDRHMGLEGPGGAYTKDTSTGQWTQPNALPSAHYLPKGCPRCQAPVLGVRRYGHIVNHSLVRLASARFTTSCTADADRATSALQTAYREASPKAVLEVVRQLKKNLVTCKKIPTQRVYKACQTYAAKTSTAPSLLIPAPDLGPYCRALMLLARAHTCRMQLVAMGHLDSTVTTVVQADTAAADYSDAMRAVDKAMDEARCHGLEPLVALVHLTTAKVLVARAVTLGYCHTAGHTATDMHRSAALELLDMAQGHVETACSGAQGQATDMGQVLADCTMLGDAITDMKIELQSHHGPANPSAKAKMLVWGCLTV